MINLAESSRSLHQVSQESHRLMRLNLNRSSRIEMIFEHKRDAAWVGARVVWSRMRNPFALPLYIDVVVTRRTGNPHWPGTEHPSLKTAPVQTVCLVECLWYRRPASPRGETRPPAFSDVLLRSFWFIFPITVTSREKCPITRNGHRVKQKQYQTIQSHNFTEWKPVFRQSSGLVSVFKFTKINRFDLLRI